MGLIEFLRLHNNGSYAARILALLHKPVRPAKLRSLLRRLTMLTERGSDPA